MILRSTIPVLLAAICLGSLPAWAQGTITENINNTGIPRNAPSLGLSSIYGLNPCSSGTAVGVTTPLFGIGGAVADIDKDCETRNNAAVVITGLKDETLAREILCTIRDIRQAAIRVGKPCLQDQPSPKVSAAAPPPSPDQPTPPIKVAPAAMNVPVAPSIRAEAPEFCHTKGLDLALYPDCTEGSAPASPVGAKGPVKVLAKASPVAPSARQPSAKSDSVRPTATARQYPPRPPQAQECEARGAGTSGGACQAETIAQAALQRTWITMIARQRIELAVAELRREAANQTQAEAAAANAERPSASGAMLAYAAPAGQ